MPTRVSSSSMCSRGNWSASSVSRWSKAAVSTRAGSRSETVGIRTSDWSLATTRSGVGWSHAPEPSAAGSGALAQSSATSISTLPTTPDLDGGVRLRRLLERVVVHRQAVLVPDPEGAVDQRGGDVLGCRAQRRLTDGVEQHPLEARVGGEGLAHAEGDLVTAVVRIDRDRPAGLDHLDVEAQVLRGGDLDDDVDPVRGELADRRPPGRPGGSSPCGGRRRPSPGRPSRRCSPW